MIEITHYKAIENSTKKASFSIKISKWGNFFIKDISYFKKEEQRWITFPSRPYEEDGKKKYFLYNGFEDPKMMKSFQEKVFEALDAYLASNSQVLEQTKVPF